MYGPGLFNTGQNNGPDSYMNRSLFNNMGGNQFMPNAAAAQAAGMQNFMDANHRNLNQQNMMNKGGFTPNYDQLNQYQGQPGRLGTD